MTHRPGGPVVVIGPWPDEPHPADVDLLDADERGELDGFDRPREAAGFVTSRAALRRAAAGWLGCAPRDVRLVAPRGGRPRIDGLDLACSITHSGDVVAVAVGRAGRIGIDIEAEDGTIPIDELADIARDVLGAPAADIGGIRHGPHGARAFFERWTLTEAVLKALGTGFAADPRDVRIQVRGGGPRLLGAPGVPRLAARDWRISLLSLGDGHVAALATDRDLGPPVVVTSR